MVRAKYCALLPGATVIGPWLKRSRRQSGYVLSAHGPSTCAACSGRGTCAEAGSASVGSTAATVARTAHLQRMSRTLARIVGTVFIRASLLTGIGLLAVLVPAGGAHADERIQAGPSIRYTTPSVTVDQGERLTFQNLDVVGHDVTATQRGPDGRALFRTPVIGGGQEAFVEGSQFLTTGS